MQEAHRAPSREPSRATPIDPEDAARLWMGTKKNPMVVTAVLMLDDPIDEATLLELVASRVLVHVRFRQRVEVPLGPLRRPRWREDATVSARDHVTVISSGRDLAGIVSGLCTPLDPRRHAWRMWLVHRTGKDDPERGDAGSAIVVQMHHAIADGFALLQALFSFSDEGAGTLAPPSPPAPRTPRGRGASVLLEGKALARTLLHHAAAPGALSGRLGGRKRVDWTEALDLESLLRAAHAADAHLNDFILGTFAGVLRGFLARHHSRSRGDVQALVPVALAHDSGPLGNRYASVFVPLPVEHADPVARIQTVRDAMQRARADVPANRGIVAMAGAIGGSLERIGVRLLSRRASLVASNVAGPPVHLHLGGRRIGSMAFAAPAPGSIALSVNALSYAGVLRVTIASDERVIPAPDELTRAFEHEARIAMEYPLGRSS